MIGSSDNSSGVVVGALVCTVAGSNLALCFDFFSRRSHIKQKKNCPKITTYLSWMHSRAIQCKQAAYISILIEVGNGRHVNVRAWPRPSRGAWAENFANAWLPIQTYMG